MAGNSRSGRRRQPAAMRALKGAKTRPHHRSEPSFTERTPDMPPFVAADAMAVAKWRVLAPRLAAGKVLTEADGEMLALLCMAWADLERYREQYAEMKYQALVVDEIVSSTGERRRKVKPNPLVALIREASLRVSRFLGEFGLTPLTRAKVGTQDGEKEDDPFAKFLKDDPLFSRQTPAH